MSGFVFFFFQAEDGIRDLVRSRGLGDVYKRQGNYMFVEWPELLEPLMDKELWASIYIETDPNQKRIITLGS